AGYVYPFMRYRVYDPMKNKKKVLIGGIFKEIIDRLASKGYILEKKSADGYYTRFDSMMLRCVLDQMLIEAGVKILFHGLINQVEVVRKNDGKKVIKHVIVQTKDGPLIFSVKGVIDATGDADIIYHAGGQWRMGREAQGDSLVQPATLNFRMGNVGPIIPPRSLITKLIKREKARGNEITPRGNCLMFKAARRELHFNQTRVAGYDFTNPFDISKAEIEGRSQVERFVQFLRNKVSGFKKSNVVCIGTQLGIRETRRIVGEYLLTEDDIISCRLFKDRIALANYPIDIHDPTGGPETIIKHIPRGKYYSIPFRCLIPKNILNTLVAGRPISATHVAHSAIRIMPTCSAIGHAAGVAMALALSRNKTIEMNKVSIDEIQQTLRSQKAILD
ncbi:MAG: FAD-dependent oxidoreductase, partial [Promethearchaeota archaeon]